ncbi:MAG: Stk1 family PASTA domain-containing Ser/Thr kinase [Mogibacterium sp.]|nr:Stk1 family PASTA domain-containing Ser/Thr kinase [Mogibacterium sp.]
MASRVLSGRYELLEKIGDGGMAVVYKGRDKLLNRFIAVKILRPEFTKDATFVENFKRESQAAAGLSHPNIVGVYDVGREGNINYIVMELIDGQTLNKIIEEEAPMDYRKVIDISKQVAAALRVAHKNKIIHRDVKPHNIMITTDGVVKLADFGIARAVNDTTLSTSSKIVGSVHYFSPEQARGNYVDERSDIYSLGIVMYEMLTGKVPFDGENPVTVALKHINEDIVPPRELEPGIPPALERCVMKATNKYQTKRYSSADELIQELDNISFVTNITTDSIFESSDIVEKRNKRRDEFKKAVDDEVRAREEMLKPARKRKRILAFLVALLLLAAGGAFGAWKMGVFSPTKPAPDLLDRTLEEAIEVAAEEGFKLKQGKDVYSSEYAEGRVCVQDPEPGKEMPKEGTITINISKGPKDGLVPKVVGMQRDQVEAFLKEQGYELGTVKTKTSPEEEGLVFEQTPEAGSSAEKETKIDIVVSDGKGKEMGTVPSVTKLSLKEAEKQIQSAGFERGEVTYSYNDNIGKGYVIYQQWQAGMQLEKGTTIDLEVSRGPEPTPEPAPAPSENPDNPDEKSEQQENTAENGG